MSVQKKLGTFFFGLALFLAMFIDFLLMLLLSGIYQLGIVSNRTKEGLALLCTKGTWTTAVVLCPWINTYGPNATTPGAWDQFIQEMDEQDAAVAAGKATRQPIFILLNHVSFLDTIMTVVLLPPRVIWRLRVYMASYLFGLPLFSTICKVIGHFPVYFLKNEDGKFSLDQEKMKPVEERVTEHLKLGGILTVFPEGAMNKGNVDVLQTFRFGTFKRALLEDARVWMMVSVNHEKVWPIAAPIAGYPATIACGLYKYSNGGSQAKLKELKAQGVSVSPETQSSEDFVILAEHSRATMQAHYNNLKAFVDDRASGKTKKL